MDSGFHAMASGFQLSDSSFYQWHLNSGLTQNTVFDERAFWLEGGGALIRRRALNWDGAFNNSNFLSAKY